MKFFTEHPPSLEPESTSQCEAAEAENTPSQYEMQQHNKQMTTEILTGADAHKEVLRLAKEEKLQEILPEVAALWGVRHHLNTKDPALTNAGLENYEAQFHREGDVFRHTLNVVRAPNIPEVRELIGEMYPEIDEEGEEIVESFFKETGPELAWSLLLHDIGKKDTQASALKKDFKPAGHYSFGGHGKCSAEIFEKEIAPRFNFTPEQTEKTASLIKDHMLMHKLMRGKESFDKLTQAEKDVMLHHKYAEELLWHAFFDSIGNNTASDNTSQATQESRAKKMADFRAALKILREHAKEETAKAA